MEAESGVGGTSLMTSRWTRTHGVRCWARAPSARSSARRSRCALPSPPLPFLLSPPSHPLTHLLPLTYPRPAGDRRGGGGQADRPAADQRGADRPRRRGDRHAQAPAPPAHRRALRLSGEQERRACCWSGAGRRIDEGSTSICAVHPGILVLESASISCDPRGLKERRQSSCTRPRVYVLNPNPRAQSANAVGRPLGVSGHGVLRRRRPGPLPASVRPARRAASAGVHAAARYVARREPGPWQGMGRVIAGHGLGRSGSPGLGHSGAWAGP